MSLDRIRKLYAFNEWANARFFNVLEALEHEQLVAPLVSSYPTLLATIAHLVSAEWVWLCRWQGDSPTWVPDWVESPTLEELTMRLRTIESERAEWLGGLTEAALTEPLSYRTLGGTDSTDRLVDLLVHVVNHSSYHRGQLTTLLRQVGATPPPSDYVLFCRESHD